MKELHTLEELETLKYEQDALLVLFGGKECGVCHSIKPKLIELIAERYPKMQMVYIDCHVDTDICSQNSIFTLPVIQVFFSGQRFIEEIRSFSVQKLVDDIARPYSMMFD